MQKRSNRIGSCAGITRTTGSVGESCKKKKKPERVKKKKSKKKGLQPFRKVKDGLGGNHRKPEPNFPGSLSSIEN